MELYDWLLFLHVLSAFAVVASLTTLWGIVFATRAGGPLEGPEAARIGAFAGPMVGAGLMGTLVFGVWLTLDIKIYDILDGWIIAALVLWAIAGWAGGAAGKAFREDPVGGRATGIRLQAVNTAVVFVILILMIWKPGA